MSERYKMSIKHIPTDKELVWVIIEKSHSDVLEMIKDGLKYGFVLELGGGLTVVINSKLIENCIIEYFKI